jgi:hypothetical protein
LLVYSKRARLSIHKMKKKGDNYFIGY